MASGSTCGCAAQGTGKSRQEVLELAAGFGSKIAPFDSANFEEIQGEPAGAEVTVPEVLLINARCELMLATVFGDGNGGVPENVPPSPPSPRRRRAAIP